MCNGANLAYTKAVFESVGGFSGIDHIASGDDMLLLHKIYQQFPGRVAYVKSPDVIVTTQPPATLREFFRQRIRWASKASHYQDRRIFLVLLLVYVLNVWILALMVAALFSVEYRLHALLLVVVKTSVELLFLWRVADFFSCRAPLIWFPFAQPFHVLYTVISGWLGKFGHYSWKGRTVR
jgi:cellulose synthase/poly-beta-1,6-N-acetylglucosamine synthase-like glycosyltransferase